MSAEGSLGLLVRYVISSGPGSDAPLDITREQLTAWMEEAGVDTAFLPPPAREVDAFRVATSSLTDEYSLADGTTVRLVVREVLQTKDYVMRRVVRIASTKQDPDSQLETRVADLQFFRVRRMSQGRIVGTARLRTLVDKRLRGRDKEHVTALVRRCEEGYAANHATIPTHVLRTLVRTYLIALGGIALVDATGGEYILPPQAREDVERIRSVVRKCSPACRLRIIPLVDDPDLREMIVESVDVDVEYRALAAMRALTEWRKKYPRVVPSARRWTIWRADCRILQDVLLSYMEQYDTIFERAAAALEDLMAMTNDMGRRVARSVQ